MFVPAFLQSRVHTVPYMDICRPNHAHMDTAGHLPGAPDNPRLDGGKTRAWCQTSGWYRHMSATQVSGYPVFSKRATTSNYSLDSKGQFTISLQY